MNAFYSYREKRTGLTFPGHLLFSRHCIVYITDIIPFNLYNRLRSNVPNVTKLLSGWDWSQPRLFLTPKTIKKKRIFQQSWEYTSKTFHHRERHWPKSLAAYTEDPAATISCALTTISSIFTQRPCCSQPVNKGSRSGHGGQLPSKEKTSLDCMANEDVSTQPSLSSISLSLESYLHPDLIALPASLHFLPLFSS